MVPFIAVELKRNNTPTQAGMYICRESLGDKPLPVEVVESWHPGIFTYAKPANDNDYDVAAALEWSQPIEVITTESSGSNVREEGP